MQITAQKKGFGLGGAVAGDLLLGPVGLLAGLPGSRKIKITCLKCGEEFDPGSRLGATYIPRPSSLLWIAIFGLLTGVPGFYLSTECLLSPSPTAYTLFNRVCSLVTLPLDVVLTAGCITLFGRPRAWARRWLLWWSLLVSVYQTLALLIMVQWIGPHATAADIGLGEMSGELNNALGPGMIPTIVSLTAAIDWLSMISLSAWVGWAFTRQYMIAFFESENASTAPPIS